jgi:hypothetical protein
MPPKGGFRQRLRAAPAAAADGVPRLAAPLDVPAAAAPVREHSQLSSVLLQLWGWGVLSASTIQTVAAAAVMDGLSCADLLKLSQLGSAGLYQGNMSRDLHTNCLGDIRVPPTYNVQVPAMQNGAVVQCEAKLILPHQLFAAVAETWPNYLSTWHQNLSNCWRGCAGDPALHGPHPVKDVPRWRDRAIPLLVYGDGARMTRLDSFEICAWSPLLLKASTWSSRFIMGGWISGGQLKGEGGTWDAIWAVLFTYDNATLMNVNYFQ